MKSCDCGRVKHISSLKRSCQNKNQRHPVSMIESIQMQQFQFNGPLNNPGSKYNYLHGQGSMETGIHRDAIRRVRNRNGCRKSKSSRSMENDLSQCMQSRHMIPSIIPVIAPVVVPIQYFPGYETCNQGICSISGHGKRIQYQCNNSRYKQLNGGKLKVKRNNVHKQMRKHPPKSSVHMVKKWQRNDRSATDKGRTFYVRRIRNREGKLLYTSDESSADETFPAETKSSLIVSNDDDVSEEKTDVTTNLLEKEPALDINEPLTSFVDPGKCAPIYQAFFEHVQVNEGDEVLVRRSDDDYENKNWPLFFVQIQRDDLLDVLEEQLDSLQPTASISKEELQVGTLCISFCRAFESMFRAVITNICNADIEVHYIDYGNYETVKKDDLKSISNLPEIARTYPGMAIPCMLFNSHAATLCVGAEDEVVAKLKDAVSCEHHSFRIQVLEILEDGICIVKHISS
uniref:Tudor domain-containing protein n=1 Tax=Elaeophora elaphi TaxID=1147741 RepID=A0A0R3RW62_9BILA